MRRLRIASLDCVITGGPDGAGGGSGPVVVLLHGFGAPGDDLVPLTHVLDVPRDVRFVFPEAPLDLGFGRAWWMIDMARLERAMAAGTHRDQANDVPEGLAEARAKVDALLDALPATIGDGPLVLGGFSQGAMLSTDVALRSSRPLAALALMSGTLLAQQEWTPLMPARRGLRVLMSHGRDDALLAYAAAERLRDLLREAGADVELIPFAGGHEIPHAVIDALGRLIKASR